MNKITQLTPAQEKQIPKYIQKYVDLASKPTNRKKATKAVQALYENAGYKKPIVIFGKSPFQTAVMVAMCKILFKNDLVKDHSQLYSQLGSQLDSQLYSQLDSQLRSQLGSQLGSINSDWWLIVWWLVWAAWYEFGKHIGVKFDNKVYKIFIDFVTNVSFLIPYEGIVFISETPTISWENKRLSSTTGPAIEWADGYKLYSINGVAFDEDLWKKVTNKNVKMSEIFAIENVEQRRVAYEIQNKSKMLELPDCKILDKVKDDGYGNPMKIIEFTVGGFESPFKYVNWFCPSTKREYFHEISGTDITDCFEAKNNSFRLPGGITFGKEF